MTRAPVYVAVWQKAGWLAMLLLASCADPHRSALDPAGIQARRISHEWWLFLWTCLGVYVLVLITLAMAIARKRKGGNPPRVEPQEPARERRMLRTVGTCVGATVVILFMFLLVDLFTGQALSRMPDDPLTVKVTGHQWSWEIQYVHFPGEPRCTARR